MAVLPNSRNQLTNIVQIVDPVSGNATQPAYIDLRQRITAVAPDDRFLIVDKSLDQWSNISLKYMGDARSYWAIADLSGVVDAFSDLDNAVTNAIPLRIPSIQRYLFSILSPNTLGS